MIYPRLLQSVWQKTQDTAIFDIDHNGIGPLSDCISCTVTEEKNGSYTLSMEYPVGGVRWLDIDVGRTIVCKPNQHAQEQPFIIKKISKAMGGKVKIDAEHLSYNANGILVTGFNAGNSGGFRTSLNDSALENYFIFDTDIVKTGVYIGVYKPPRSIRSLLLDDKTGSFISLYGGEFEFDRLSIFAHTSRGTDRGVTIRYGKNLTALTQTRTAREFATAVYPYWHNENSDGTRYVELSEKILQFGVSDYSDIYKTIPLDLTSQFDEAPTKSDLRNAAITWINDNWKEAPLFNLNISFIELAKTTEYADIANAETVKLCDTITVIHPEFGLSNKMQVIKTVYNALQDRYKSIEVGDPIDSLASTILKLTGGKK